MNVADWLSKDYIYAVVGASSDPAKYGNIVFRDLVAAGWRVAPVNPKKPTIDGTIAVGFLRDVQPRPDVVVFVVPPEVGLAVMEEAATLGIKKLWFQPGAESEEIRQRAKELRLDAVTDGLCIMVDRHQVEKTPSRRTQKKHD